MFLKKTVMKNDANFTEKNMLQSLFYLKSDKLAGIDKTASHVFFCKFYKLF